MHVVWVYVVAVALALDCRRVQVVAVPGCPCDFSVQISEVFSGVDAVVSQALSLFLIVLDVLALFKSQLVVPSSLEGWSQEVVSVVW